MNSNMKTTANRNGALAEAKKWWGGTDFRQMAIITGFRQYEFNPDDGYQEFVDACDNYWHDLNDIEKINIYNEFN